MEKGLICAYIFVSFIGFRLEKETILPNIAYWQTLHLLLGNKLHGPTRRSRHCKRESHTAESARARYACRARTIAARSANASRVRTKSAACPRAGASFARTCHTHGPPHVFQCSATRTVADRHAHAGSGGSEESGLGQCRCVMLLLGRSGRLPATRTQQQRDPDEQAAGAPQAQHAPACWISS